MYKMCLCYRSLERFNYVYRVFANKGLYKLLLLLLLLLLCYIASGTLNPLVVFHL